MFIRKSPGQKQIEYVNLKQVSYVNVTKDRIILNMCVTYTDYSWGRDISKAHYLERDNDEFMSSEYFLKNFIKVEGDDRLTFINKNFVSSIIGETPLDREDKIIVNFNYSVSGAPNKYVPDYLYVRVKEGVEVNAYLRELVEKLDD